MTGGPEPSEHLKLNPIISLSGNITHLRISWPPSLCAVQPPAAKGHCHLIVLQNAESFLHKEHEHMMKCMLNLSGTELHPAQKADLWGEETGSGDG